MIVNGWSLFNYLLFDQQLDRLVDRVKAARKADPTGYRNQPATKLLATIHRHIHEIIPANPAASEFRQGNTLGKDNRHWFRAKFHDRYRLFFRFSSSEKIIVYAWVNDESTLRKEGSKTDPYALFQAMLNAGTPPRTLQELLAGSRPAERDRTPGARP